MDRMAPQFPINGQYPSNAVFVKMLEMAIDLPLDYRAELVRAKHKVKNIRYEIHSRE